ncbi:MULTISPECIES: DUF397 domain-containing protein [Thermomonosporaceae]|uniref:DUF397 domain-containing protein n=1 Tax=Thermomonosporaceae TaxID=2012 RepID=UPI00255B0888|nr:MULTISPECIES: DUF397 domain-containing protein [Thermomonosporaceae]MDL4774850.1 DUF397 domain-containing protein [Actinomadura xylanilytica]
MTTWRKSSHSGTTQSDCVEVAALPDGVGVRDSKNPHGPTLLLDRSAFRTLVTDLKR